MSGMFIVSIRGMVYTVNRHKREMMYKLTLDATDDNMQRTACG